MGYLEEYVNKLAEEKFNVKKKELIVKLIEKGLEKDLILNSIDCTEDEFNDIYKELTGFDARFIYNGCKINIFKALSEYKDDIIAVQRRNDWTIQVMCTADVS